MRLNVPSSLPSPVIEPIDLGLTSDGPADIDNVDVGAAISLGNRPVELGLDVSWTRSRRTHARGGCMRLVEAAARILGIDVTTLHADER